MRDRVRQFIEKAPVQRFIIAVIVINAITLGLETSGSMTEHYGGALHFADRVALAIFVVELLLKMYAYRLAFLRDPWNWFDAIIIGVSLVPAAGNLSVLRSLRILRVLRLVSAVPSLRRVVSGLLKAVPGVASILVLLSLVLYVAAVMATKLFGDTSPQHFGSLPRSLFTLFQTMTGEAWPEIANDVMRHHPLAWIFFVIYILISTFVVLNLFLAVVVSAMEEDQREELAAERDMTAEILIELGKLRAEIQAMREDRLTPSDGHRVGPP